MPATLLRHGRLLAILGILILFIAAADRSDLRWDLSADHRFTMSDALQKVLRHQSEPVSFVGIWSADDEGEYARTRDMMKRMAAVNERITWRTIDPVLHKPQLEDFKARFHEADAPALYLTRGERLFKISLPNPMNARFNAQFQQEIGGGLVALADPTPPVIVITQGHGELRPGGGTDDGIDYLIQAWRLAGLRVETRDISHDKIHAHEILALLGPSSALGPIDLATLTHHLDDSGAVLILADDRAPADMMALLRQRGIVLGGLSKSFFDQLSTDAATALRSPVTHTPPIIASRRHFSVGQDSAHPEPNIVCDGDGLNSAFSVTASISNSGRAVLSPWSTPLTVLDPNGFSDPAFAQRLSSAFTSIGTPPFTSALLMRTAEQDAWLKKRADPLTIPADLSRLTAQPLLYAIEYQTRAGSAQADHGARMLIWSSRQAASDGVLSQERWANAPLLVRGAEWLAQRTSTTDIPTASTATFRIDCSDNALAWIAALMAAIVPCMCIGAAMLAWWDQR